MTVAQEAKNYCMQNPAIAQYNIFANYTLFIHGVNYGTDDEIFVSEIFGNTRKYRKVRIRYDAKKSPYIIIDTKRYYLDQFVKPQ